MTDTNTRNVPLALLREVENEIHGLKKCAHGEGRVWLTGEYARMSEQLLAIINED